MKNMFYNIFLDLHQKYPRIPHAFVRQVRESLSE